MTLSITAHTTGDWRRPRPARYSPDLSLFKRPNTPSFRQSLRSRGLASFRLLPFRQFRGDHRWSDSNVNTERICLTCMPWSNDQLVLSTWNLPMSVTKSAGVPILNQFGNSVKELVQLRWGN